MLPIQYLLNEYIANLNADMVDLLEDSSSFELLISQGVDIQSVSKRLGHARTSTTTDIYAHALRRPIKKLLKN
jgi:site-specific recombinase XerD